MIEPYRDRYFRCPACPESALREFHDRLVCDVCSGIFVTRADLDEAIEQLGGLAAELEFFKDKPGTRACPRCTQAMTACRLRIKFPVIEEQPKTKPTLDRCDNDGIWFDAAELAKVFEVVNRAAGGNGSGDYGTVGTMRPGAGRGWGFGT